MEPVHPVLVQRLLIIRARFVGMGDTLEAGAADGHHNQVRFGWELGPGSGPAPIAGFDVAVLT